MTSLFTLASHVKYNVTLIYFSQCSSSNVIPGLEGANQRDHAGIEELLTWDIISKQSRGNGAGKLEASVDGLATGYTYWHIVVM